MIYKDGTNSRLGDLITWNSWDSDNNTTRVMIGMIKRNKVIYLGGGMDCGMGIGKDIDISKL